VRTSAPTDPPLTGRIVVAPGAPRSLSTQLPTKEQYTARFTEYVKAIGGECVDELVPKTTTRQKKADFLLYKRSIVAELKCIATDYSQLAQQNDRRERVMEHAISTGLVSARQVLSRRVLADGRIATKYRLDTPVAEAVRSDLLNAESVPLRRLAKEVSEQVRATADELGIDEFAGLLVLINLADQRLDPSNFFWMIGRALLDYRQTLHYVALFSPHLGAVLPDGRRASLMFTGMNGEQSDEGMSKLSALMGGWLRFNETGHYLDVESMGPSRS
jgi:hypothetical protein